MGLVIFQLGKISIKSEGTVKNLQAGSAQAFCQEVGGRDAQQGDLPSIFVWSENRNYKNLVVSFKTKRWPLLWEINF